MCRSTEAVIIATVVTPGTDVPIGKQYGCQRCGSAFTVVRGVAALWKDRVSQVLSDTVAPAHPSPVSRPREIPVQRDEDMAWDRRR